MKELSKRFWDAEWHSSKRFEAIDIVTVIGAGGVGSWLTFMLTRAEFKCILFDHDKVEEHNLGGQLFGLDNIGTEKVYATEKLCKESHKGNIMPIPFKYGKEYLTQLSPITVSAVDS